MPSTEPGPASYASAGVDIDAGERAVAQFRPFAEKATRPEVMGGIGGFAGLFDASALRGFDRPVLATSADGVGTKVAIAQQADIHDTIGFDLVGMLVDDLVVCGAEPLYLTDYIACGRVVPERVAAIVKGIAEACITAGCALLGGEIAFERHLPVDAIDFALLGLAILAIHRMDLVVFQMHRHVSQRNLLQLGVHRRRDDDVQWLPFDEVATTRHAGGLHQGGKR